MYNRVLRSCFILATRTNPLIKNHATCSVGTDSIAVLSLKSYQRLAGQVFVHNYCTSLEDNRRLGESSVSDIENGKSNTTALLPIDENAQKKVDELLKDPAMEQLYKIIQLEIDLLSHDAERVPQKIRPRDWLSLLQCTSKSQRRKFLNFLWLNEIKHLNIKEKKQLVKQQNQENFEQLSNEWTSGIEYGLGHNCMFMRVYEQTMRAFYNLKLIQSVMYGQKVVIDCGYEDHMTMREIKNCAKQLAISYSQNRDHIDPFDIYLCNANREGPLMTAVTNIIPHIYNETSPMNVTHFSYLDIFDKNKLIYLTPHCKQEMEEYDHDAVYIIGGIVDKAKATPLSLAKAKKEGLRMAKFPLDRYLKWGTGSQKSLTINHVVAILLDLKEHVSWEVCLKAHIPKRKLMEAAERREEKKRLKMQEMRQEMDYFPNQRHNIYGAKSS